MFWRQIEAAIRVGADGAEWLVWESKAEALVSGRMTASYSVTGALDQWLARAARLHMKPKRIWLIAGAAECAHRRITLPGTDLKVVSQAIPFAVEEDLPLPLSQMYWSYRTQIDEQNQSTLVDVVATPTSLFSEWEEALRGRRIEIAGRIPEGPHLWNEMAAMRGAEVDLLTVWGERRATLIRGSEASMTSLMAFVREPGESWEAVLSDLRRPFQARDESKAILSIFTSDRLRKRILALPDLIPSSSENYLNHDLFIRVPEQMVVPVSLLALRRARLEAREPSILFGDTEAGRGRGELKRVATTLEVPHQAIAAAFLLVLSLSLWWAEGRIGRRYVSELVETPLNALDALTEQSAMLRQQGGALADLAKMRADWGSVWLELSQRVQEGTSFKSFSFGQGTGIRIDGTTANQGMLDGLVRMLRETGYLKNVRIPKTEPSGQALSFQILAEFDSSKVKVYKVGEKKEGESEEQKKPPEEKGRKKRLESLSPPVKRGPAADAGGKS
jgi:Tfp pilus assembly protein PilN